MDRTRETDIRRTSNIQYPVCVPLHGVTFEKKITRKEYGRWLSVKFVRTKNIIPGMVTARSICNESGNLLLAANHTITNTNIRQIRALEYAGIYIYDKYSDYEFFDEIITQQERVQAATALKTIDIDKVIYYTNKIVNEMLGRDELLLDLQDMRSHHDATYNHCINVSLYATACGIGLGMQQKELQDLATAAMLHDIGKTMIDTSILDKPGKLTDEERAIINKHPQIGYDMLYGNPGISAATRAGVLLHHENEDGSGYPKGLSGNEIPLIAKIIHVADVYDALCSKRAYKDDYQASESIEFLMSHCGTMFDLHVVETFLKYLVLYPVGCDVELSDGRIARVIKNRAESVQRPIVITNHETIDMLKVLNITIIREID